MLYFLYTDFSINIFKYITFRAGLGFFLGFTLCCVLMPYFIKWANSHKTTQPINEYVSAHKAKANTPTMGGIVFVVATIIPSLLLMRFSAYAVIGLLCLVGFCLIGLKDDYTKIKTGKNDGMSAKTKFALISMLSLFVVLLLLYFGFDMTLYLPFLKTPIYTCSFALIAILFWIFIINASANAVNLTDGLDGLATFPSITALASLGIFAYVSGNLELSNYLFYPKVATLGELSVIVFSLIGALFGFLWYNSHPAQVFMGDSGSLAIGGFIGYCSIVTHNEFLLILMGFVFVIETLSVILQVGSYKLRKKRIFLMAPLHHHFEKLGLAENKIIVRFWIVAILSNIVALISLKIR